MILFKDIKYIIDKVLCIKWKRKTLKVKPDIPANLDVILVDKYSICSKQKSDDKSWLQYLNKVN